MSNTYKPITKEQVAHVGKNLCKLNLSDAELEKFSTLLTDTLDYIEVFEELDVSEVTETFQVTGTSNVFGDKDKIKATLSVEEALLNASDNTNNLFGTKKVL